MKRVFLSTIIVVLSAMICFAQAEVNQKNEPPVVDGVAPTSGNKNVSKSEEDTNTDSSLNAGTTLSGKLQSTLDVKNSKVGDPIVLKTTKSIKEDGEVIIPKGTKLIGRVTEVQQKTKDAAMSKISIIFESIQSKNLSAPLSATITSITSVSSNVATGDLFSSGSSANSNSSGAVSSGNSSGGLLGGGLLGGATQTVGGVVNGATQTVGGLTNVAGQTVGGVSNSAGALTKGLQISQSAAASGSSTISAQGKNVKIEKGANFNLILTKSIEN